MKQLAIPSKLPILLSHLSKDLILEAPADDQLSPHSAIIPHNAPFHVLLSHCLPYPRPTIVMLPTQQVCHEWAASHKLWDNLQGDYSRDVLPCSQPYQDSCQIHPDHLRALHAYCAVYRIYLPHLLQAISWHSLRFAPVGASHFHGDDTLIRYQESMLIRFTKAYASRLSVHGSTGVMTSMRRLMDKLPYVAAATKPDEESIPAKYVHKSDSWRQGYLAAIQDSAHDAIAATTTHGHIQRLEPVRPTTCRPFQHREIKKSVKTV